MFMEMELAPLNSTHDFRVSGTILYCGTCIYTDTNVLSFQCSIIWPLLFNYQENFANCNFCISYHVYNSQLPKYLNRATIHSFQVLFKLFPRVIKLVRIGRATWNQLTWPNLLDSKRRFFLVTRSLRISRRLFFCIFLLVRSVIKIKKKEKRKRNLCQILNLCFDTLNNRYSLSYVF